VVVVVPSPLEGEGVNAVRQTVMGEGLQTIERPIPLTQQDFLKFRTALSLKGRGHEMRAPIFLTQYGCML